MKVVFLDFDGVLNRGSGRGVPALVENLNRITRRTGAVIVVHSSWRYGRGLEMLRHVLEGWGVKGEVIDATPVPDGAQLKFSGHIIIGDAEMEAFMEALPDEQRSAEDFGMWDYERPCSIQKWLDTHPEVEQFTILDDHPIMAHLHEHHVHTKLNVGLTKPQSDQAIRMLGGPK